MLLQCVVLVVFVVDFVVAVVWRVVGEMVVVVLFVLSQLYQ